MKITDNLIIIRCASCTKETVISERSGTTMFAAQVKSPSAECEFTEFQIHIETLCKECKK